MFHIARTVAIDDSQDDLAKLEAGIKGFGSSCLSIVFNGLGSLPTTSMKGIRFVFMDINLLSGSAPNPQVLFSNIHSILDRLIADENGPYVLVTWTNTAYHQGLMQYLEQRLNANKRPFASRSLDKHTYLTQPKKLLRALGSMHNSIPQMAAILDWEMRVQEAVVDTIHNLKTVSAMQSASNVSDQLNILMSELAIAASGEKNAGRNKLASFNEAISPILYDNILHICSDAIPNKLWNGAITKIDPSHRVKLTDKQKGMINTHLLISKQLNKIQPYDRGVVVKLPAAWLKDKEFKKRFHAPRADTAPDQYKIPDSEVVEWVLVQTQAACDAAQCNPGPIPFMLGVMRKYKKNLNSSAPASLWRSPVLCDDNSSDPYEFLFSSRYVISISRSALNKNKFKILGRFKEQMINGIANHLHSYSQRIGYISLN